MGLEVIDYNGWDSASVQSYMKYSYHGQYLEHDFLDAVQADWSVWRQTGSTYYGQCALIGPDGKVYFMDTYSINITALSNSIEDIIYGVGIESTSLGELKATFK